MEAVVHVSLKKTVLDPQGRAIRAALQNLGADFVSDVRAGKFFEIQLADGLDADAARRQVEKIARELLANPVIEDFSVEIKP